jgi:aminobenzoyl-glutamate utilization protein B
MFLKKLLPFACAAVLLLASAARTAEKAAPSKEKEFVFKVVERNSKAIALLGDNIYYFAELGLQEFETAKLMTQILEDAGFKVERGISGMPTAFMATYG